MRAGRTAAARLLATTAAALLLSGCYAAELDAEVSEEGTMSGTLFVGVALNSPEGDGEVDGKRIFNQETAEQMFPGSTVEETISETGYLGQQITFAGAPLDYFDNQAVMDALATRLTITRDGTEFVVDGTQDLSFLTPSQGEDIPDPQVELTLTFPGEVTDSNGQVTGRTVTWTNPSAMTARAGAAAIFPFQLIGIGVGAFVVLAGVSWLLIRRRSAGQLAPVEDGQKSTKQVKAKKLPKRRAPKSSPKRAPIVAERPVIAPPADWWLDTAAPQARAAIELSSPASASNSGARSVAVEDLEQINTEVEDTVIGLYGPPEKKRRGR